MTNTIVDIHRMSRRSYGSPRVHAELRLGAGIRCSRKRVERLMRQAGVAGIYRRRGRGWTRRDPQAILNDDLVGRQFDPPGPDRLWFMDVTEHPTGEGKLYLAVVLDAFSRRVVGWSITDHIHSELVVDSLQMAIGVANHPEVRSSPTRITARRPIESGEFTAWAFTRRAQESGLVASMGSIGDCFDNAVIESFWGRMQVELLKRRKWKTRIELANAIFEYLEIFHNRQRRHSSLGMLTPIEYENLDRVTVA